MKKLLLVLVSLLITNSCFASLVGTWQQTVNGKEFQLTYETNTVWYCSLDVAFTLTNGGQVLTVGGTAYTRQSGSDPASVVGHWRSADEDLYYRTDGRSFTLFDGEAISYFGTYTVSGNTITDCDYRGQYYLTGNSLTQYVHGSGPSTTTVTITPAVKIVFPGGNTWTWVP